MSHKFVICGCLKITLATGEFTSLMHILNVPTQMPIGTEIAGAFFAIKSCARMMLLLVLHQLFQRRRFLSTLVAGMIHIRIWNKVFISRKLNVIVNDQVA